MKRFRAMKPLAWVLIFVVTTVLTEVGGVILVAAWFGFGRIFRKRRSITLATVATYVFLVLVVIPQVAPWFGRVALPIWATSENPVAPRSWIFVLTCRNYVSPELKALILESARELREKHPDAVTHYLDANFPFIDGIPLLPHLSHDDGDKMDFAVFLSRSRVRNISSVSVSHWLLGLRSA